MVTQTVRSSPPPGDTDDIARLKLELKAERRARKAAEAALAAARGPSAPEGTAPWADIVEALPDAVCIYDPDLRLVAVNGAFLRLHPDLAPILEPGTPRSDLIAAMPRDATPETESAPRMLERGGRWIREREVQTPDGFIVCLHSDVTDRKAADDAMKESEARLQALMGHSPAGIFMRDRDGRFLHANRAYEKRWGLAPGESAGKSLHDFFPPDRVEEFLALDRDLVENGPVTRETEVVLPGDDVRTTLIHKFVVTGEDGSHDTIVGISTDITERKRTEEALRASEARLRAIVENSPAAVYVRDRSGRYVLANHELHRRLGLPEGAVIGKHVSEVLNPEWARQALDLDQQILQDRRPVARELVWTQADGRRHNVLIVKFPILREGGEADSVGIISTDMTEVRETEARLHQQQAELAHAYRLNIMGEMASGLAHELNQPLSAIVSYARGCVHRLRAGAEADDTEDLIDAMNKVAEQAQRAGQIIRWMRDFVRKGGGQKSPTDIEAVLNECASVMNHAFEKHNVTVERVIEQGLPAVVADKTQVQQVVLNLIRNAVEAMGDDEPGNRLLRIVCRGTAAGLEVSVADSGPGMSADTRARLFDPFFTTKPEGLGMGLSICRRVIEGHDGRLWVDSDAAGGNGSVFRFTLPVTPQADGTAA